MYKHNRLYYILIEGFHYRSGGKCDKNVMYKEKKLNKKPEQEEVWKGENKTKQ